ncbi:hypothetical protein DACRYDRAFT_115997 [Dacryopinax primogenitus]|uniref:Uncharacterized protein n=1 Tax=Dacryopinax primogenitus (strain DJM 731) TaxID=1858805 RepID=M5FWG1_DACPD|nr:uncharacterized protein DACRYDRAFT_115997 [Dacryopinax primogenitus]EJU02266.1 hypothetical protein DACRYDRAFT_115997 [Dacryopinax primogenitus]
MAPERGLKRPWNEESNVHNLPSKILRTDVDSELETRQVIRWMHSRSSWIRNVGWLNKVQEGDEKTELEQELRNELLSSIIEEGEEISAALQQLALEIVRAVQRDPAVLATELGKFYDTIRPPKVADARKESMMRVVSARAQAEATIKSWTSDYEGDAVRRFQSHLRTAAFMGAAASNLYAKSFVVANSSGMGKTRMIDESSKTLFTILFVLSDASGGFPPADNDVLTYFLFPRKLKDCHTAIMCFLQILFDELAEVLRHGQERLGTAKHAELANWFRGYMATWTHISEPSPTRVEFFRRVVKKSELATELALKEEGSTWKTQGNQSPRLSTRDNTCKSDMIASFQNLSDLLNHGHDDSLPTVLLAFDEAHTLLRTVANDDGEIDSVYSVLRRVLRYLNENSFLACFLSTSASVTQFDSPMRFDPSTRMQSGKYHTFPAFTRFPFNMARVQPDEMDLTVVGKDDFMCKQSRILFRKRAEYGVGNDVGDSLVDFAREKLLGSSAASGFDDEQKLAILSRRIPIDIRTNTGAALTSINRQIARHMRVLYRITNKNETLITGSPGEPIISEGAKGAMATFNVADALKGILRSPGIGVGERGEMVAELLLVLASDASTREGKFSIPAFFESLLTPISWKELKESRASRGRLFHIKSFQQTFENSYGNFNHIIKIRGSVPGPKSWYRYLTRRAGISTQFGQYGIDAAFPCTINGTEIARDNTSSMLIQVKAVASMQSPQELVFEKMDRIVAEMQDEDDTKSSSQGKGKRQEEGEPEPELKLIPVIRVVLSLKSNEAQVTVMEYEDYDNEMLTWDIYVPFLALKAVQQNPDVWRSALHMELDAGTVYEDDAILKGMDPGAEESDEFWPNWDPMEG